MNRLVINNGDYGIRRRGCPTNVADGDGTVTFKGKRLRPLVITAVANPTALASFTKLGSAGYKVGSASSFWTIANRALAVSCNW